MTILSKSLVTLLILGCSASAVDLPSDGPTIEGSGMPTLQVGEYGTDLDNENNARDGIADGDMDTYLFNTSSKHPIEFNINLPFDPDNQTGTLVMNVYDIDLPHEVDEVYLNEYKLGTLTGKNGKWGMNRFAIPLGLLHKGDNLVEILVDTKKKGMWATNIDFAYITGLAPAKQGIKKCWVAPTAVYAGEYVNFFAEISGSPKRIELYNGDNRVQPNTFLTDPDGDGVYSAQYRIPAYTEPNSNWQFNYKVRATGPWGIDWCPGVKIKKRLKK